MSLDGLFADIVKKTEKDPDAQIHVAGDITMGSRVPYGILSGLPELELALGRPGYPCRS
jgi:hypothetical protein